MNRTFLLVGSLLVALASGTVQNFHFLPSVSLTQQNPGALRVQVGYNTPGVTSTADVNGDGLPDLLVAADSRGIDVFLGNATTGLPLNPSFSLTVDTSLAVTSVAAGDVNGDGIVDLVACLWYTWTSAFAVLLGLGGGSFGTPTVTPTLTGPHTGVNWGAFRSYYIRLADMNNDGRLDAIIGACNLLQPSIVILLNQGSGIFGSQSTSTASTTDVPATFCEAVKDFDVADLNQDGKLDVVGSGWMHSVSFAVWFGQGDGTLGAPVFHLITNSNCQTTTSSITLEVADINHDNKPDVFINIYATNCMLVYLGVGDGTFATATYAFGPSQPQTRDVAVVGDLNRDGYQDVIFDNGQLFVCFGQATSPYFGTGTACTTIESHNPDYWVAMAANIADFNGDSIPDIVSYRSGSSYYHNFYTQGTGNVDCVVAFSAWAVCSVTCGSGQQTRTATITTNAVGAGAPCVPTPTTQSCGTETCDVTVSSNLQDGQCGALLLTGHVHGAASAAPTAQPTPVPVPVPVSSPAAPVASPSSSPTPAPTPSALDPSPVPSPDPSPVPDPSPSFSDPSPVPAPTPISLSTPSTSPAPAPSPVAPSPPTSEVTYQWYRSTVATPSNSHVAIPGATAQSYAPTAADVGFYLFFEAVTSTSSTRVKASFIGLSQNCATGTYSGSAFKQRAKLR